MSEKENRNVILSDQCRNVTYVSSPIVENLVQSAALLHPRFRRKFVNISRSGLSRVCVWYVN